MKIEESSKEFPLMKISEVKNVNSLLFKLITYRNRMSLKIDRNLSFDKSGYFPSFNFLEIKVIC